MENDYAPRILIVEDEQGPRLHLQFELEKAGYQAIAAASGQEGIELFRQHSPEAILCDIHLPDMLGFQVLSSVRQEEKGRKTVFIILSARKSHEQIREGMRQGADDYLTKPYDPEDLIESLRTRLSRFQQLFSTMASNQQSYLKLVDKLNNDKTELIAEVHHRVKNNLQIILSLLQLQMRYIHSEANPTELFQDTRRRIFTISMVEKELFNSGQPPLLNFSQVAASLIQNYQTEPHFRSSGCQVHYHRQACYLDFNLSFPLALAINEIFGLFLDHAFFGYSEQHRIQVAILGDEHQLHAIEVGQNGHPFSLKAISEEEDFSKKLLSTMLNQANATLEESGEGEMSAYRLSLQGGGGVA